MPQSFSAMYAHLVFSTKNRMPMIQTIWTDRLHQYIGGIIAGRRGVLLSAGGMPDHRHFLVSLGRELSLAELVRDIKAGSSKWIHDHFPEVHDFAWQTGYGAFSVSASNLDWVTKYIDDQVRHHQSMSYQDEFRGFLRRHAIVWDERYVWD